MYNIQMHPISASG